MSSVDRGAHGHHSHPAAESLTRMPSIAVVMPAYNEATRIGQTIRSIARYQATGARIGPIIVADDGSTDDTCEIASRTAASDGLVIEVLSLPHRGKAATVRSAMLTCAPRVETEYLMMLDADDELPIDQLDRVPWSPDPLTVYIGRRVAALDGATPARPSLTRRGMSAAMRAATHLLLGIRHPDTQCGFKIFPTSVAADLFRQQRSTAWTFDAEILYIADRVSRLPIQEIPVVWSPRGTSHVRLSTAAVSSISMLSMFGRRARRVYSPVGPSAGSVMLPDSSRSTGATTTVAP